jgi:hypothetical protein
MSGAILILRERGGSRIPRPSRKPCGVAACSLIFALLNDMLEFSAIMLASSAQIITEERESELIASLSFLSPVRLCPFLADSQPLDPEGHGMRKMNYEDDSSRLSRFKEIRLKSANVLFEMG